MQFYEKRDTFKRVFFLTPKTIKTNVFYLYTKKEALSVFQESARPLAGKSWKDRNSKVFRRLAKVELLVRESGYPACPQCLDTCVQAVETI